MAKEYILQHIYCQIAGYKYNSPARLNKICLKIIYRNFEIIH